MIRAMISFSWPVLKPILAVLGLVLFAGFVMGFLIAG
jgi:hypothetical protein